MSLKITLFFRSLSLSLLLSCSSTKINQMIHNHTDLTATCSFMWNSMITGSDLHYAGQGESWNECSSHFSIVSVFALFLPFMWLGQRGLKAFNCVWCVLADPFYALPLVMHTYVVVPVCLPWPVGTVLAALPCSLRRCLD